MTVSVDRVVRRTFAMSLLLVAPAMAGHLVHGLVQDDRSSEGLAAATIQIQGTYQGTIANDVGEFALEVEQLPAVLLITHICYHTKRVTIIDSTMERANVRMTISPHRLPEMVVYPAFGADLMRRVIEHKTTWMPRIESYRAEAYTRRTMERTEEVFEINEIVSDVFWDAEKGTREVVTSVRNTANANQNMYTSALEGTANLYHDDIEFIESSLMGITHPDALDHYEFDLIGRRLVDESVVFDLSVKPKSRLHSGFEGTLAVLDEEFVLLEVDLVPTRSTMATAIPIPMIEGLTWRYRQQFRGFDGLWLPVDYRLSVTIKIGMVGFHLPLIGMEQVTRFADYEINSVEAETDTIFASDELVHMDSVAIAADTAFTRFADPVPMTAAEVVALDTITAEFKGIHVIQPTGFLVRFMDFDDDDGSDEAVELNGRGEDDGAGVPTQSTHTTKDWWQVAEFSPSGRFNRVEEALLALGAQRAGPLGLHVRAGVGFSSGLEKVNFDVGAKRRWQDEQERAIYVDLGFRRGGGSHYTSDAYPVILNTVQALLGEDDYFDYYWSEGFGLDIGVDPALWKTTARLGLRAEDHSSLTESIRYDPLSRGPMRENPAVDDGHMRRIELHVESGGKYERFGTVPNRRLEFSLEHSADWMGSDFDFTKFHFAVDWHQSTFLRRRWVPNALDFRVVGGTFRGELPVQRFGALDVAMGPISPYGTLRGVRGHPYLGESYLGFVAEHNFRTAPFEMVGLWPLVKRGFSLLVSGGYGQTWISENRRASLPLIPRWTKIPHKEVGVSLFLYHVFRVDLTRLVDPGGWAVGASLARFEFGGAS